MIGWRAKLGIIVPSANTTIEPELYKMAPQGVSIHSSRVKITEDTEEEILAMINDVPRAAEELKHAEVNVIAFGCTAGSFIKGLGYDREIIGLIERSAKIPATTTSTAVIEAFKEMGVEKLSVATPYEDWLNQKLIKFIEVSGLKVLKMKGLGITRDIAHVHPERVYRLAKEVHTLESDGVFISCTDFRTIDILNVLEQDLKKPVISSNQATMWMMLRMAGVKTPIKGFGALMTRL